MQIRSLRRGSSLACVPMVIALMGPFPGARASIAQTTGPETAIVFGRPIERRIGGRDTHSYAVPLTAGQYVRVVVEQHPPNVSLTLDAGDGTRLIDTRSPLVVESGLGVSVIARQTGIHRLTIAVVDAQIVAAPYRLVLDSPRDPTPRETQLAESDAALQEAEGLQRRREATYRQEAMPLYQRALDRRRAAADRAGEAVVIFAIGQLLNAQADPMAAREQFARALAIQEERDDRWGQARTLNAMAATVLVQGDLTGALALFDRALTLRRALGDTRGEAEAHANMALVYTRADELQHALVSYADALTKFRALGERYGEAVTLHNLAEVYESLGDDEEALAKAREALPLHRAVGPRAGEAHTLEHIATALAARGDERGAIEAFDASLAVSREIGDRFGEARALAALASFHALAGRAAEARGLFDRALAIREALNARPGGLAARLGRAGASAALGDVDAARTDYLQSLATAQALGIAGAEAAAQAGLAALDRDAGDLASALTRVTAAIRGVESVHARVDRQQLRAASLASQHRYYEIGIDVRMRLHQREPTSGHDAAAFRLSEQARARSLLRTLAEAQARVRQGADPVLLEQERLLARDIAAKAARLTNLLAGARPQGREIDRTREALEQAERRHEQVRAAIRAESPQYAALMQPEPLSLQEVQERVLDEDTLLLEYAFAGNRTFLWAVTRRTAIALELAPRHAIEGAVRRVYPLLVARNEWVAGESADARRRRLARADADASAALADLGRMLLEPVAAHLAGKRLLVVPDGALHYLPFAALPLPASTQDAATLLIAHHEIVTTPSASAIALVRQSPPHAHAPALTVGVFADPVFGQDDPRTTRDPRRAAVPAEAPFFARLRFSRQEATAIAALAGEGQARLALDFDANRETFIDEARRYRIVHLATHGVVDERRPGRTGIVLSMVNRNGERQDGFLRLGEIYNLSLSADLVVLSGCETALGRELSGEGLVGLTRGFQHAGAPRLVSSLWKIQDQATAELMTRFYRGVLRDGLRPAAALRAAQRSLSADRRWQAPYFWAGFALQGEWR